MKALHKDSFLQIKHTFKRFCSILLMALLGVGFFAGIKATSPDMKQTLDTYFDDNNIYDIDIMSTLGFNQNDIETIKSVDEIDNVLFTYSTDIEVELKEKTVIAKAYAYMNQPINQFNLIDGKMPTEEKQCVIERNFAQREGIQVGDYITVKLEENSILKDNSFEIVGTIESPLYISTERGSTKLGDGMIDCYLYIAEQSFDSDVYTQCYITVDGAKELNTFSNEYQDLIEGKINLFENVADKREEERYQEIMDEANREIAENEQKLNEAKQEANEKISEAQKEIEEGESQIRSAEQTVYQNEKKAENEFKLAEEKILEAQNKLDEQANLWNSSKQTILIQISEGEEGINQLKEAIAKIGETINSIEEKYEGITDENLLEQKKQQIDEANKQKQKLEEEQARVQTQIEEAKKTITQTEEQIANGKNEIEKNKQELQQTKNSTYNQIAQAKSTIASNKNKIEEAKETLNEEKEKANKEIKDAETKLADAKKELEKIEKPTWYVLDRTANTGYSSYEQDTERISNIGKVFPIVFFIVATLISLTSMTRMVEEQRVQIGTLKALGYSKIQIAGKYILYSSVATILGAIVGMSIGFVLLPKTIFSMYEMLYTMPDIQTEFNWLYAITGLVIASFCIVGATIYACHRELKNVPATLMRPKAPKPGKRVFLEKIPLIWKHLNFTKKVTARNIFRYKNRFLMTTIGICGCTAMILAGFGLRNSISSIIPLQYEEIYQYQMMISLKDILEEEKILKKEEIASMDKVKDILAATMESGQIEKNEEKDIQILISQDSQKLQEFIKLRNIKTHENFTLDEENVIITEKIARLLNIKVGDIIKLTNNEGKKAEVKVGAITENYIYHYIYMSNNLYESLYSTRPEENILLIKTDNISSQEEETLTKKILEDDEKIAGISKNSDAMSIMDDTMKSLDSVVWILIISAGLLALVVLYNLSNVNISERTRELATIKVLGFYDKEVYDYVTKETIILTIIGIFVGLLGGYFLNLFILETCETDMIMFNKIVAPTSYIYAGVITGVFAFIINIMTYFQLKKIDMIESLKSVE